MYIFLRACCLVLGNQSVCSSLEKNISLRNSISQLPVVLCGGLRPQELSPFRVKMSVGVVHAQVMLRQPCWLDFIDVASRHYQETHSHSRLPHPAALTMILDFTVQGGWLGFWHQAGFTSCRAGFSFNEGVTDHFFFIYSLLKRVCMMPFQFGNFLPLPLRSNAAYHQPPQYFSHTVSLGATAILADTQQSLFCSVKKTLINLLAAVSLR